MGQDTPMVGDVGVLAGGQDIPMAGMLAGGSGYSYGGGASRWVRIFLWRGC